MGKPAGRRFVEEIEAFCKMARVRWHCYDNVGSGVATCPWCSHKLKLGHGPRRPADLEFCWQGRSVLVECKELAGTARALPFSRVEEHQTKHLRKQFLSGGIGLILVRHNLARPRAFALPAVTWLAVLESDRRSLPLADGERPHGLVELHRARIRDQESLDQGVPNDLVWDLRPVLEAP